MQYFGVPVCPYCKKRVNLIRTWSLKKQGEYKCPRCGGITNIYLSPLIYVFAVIAIFASGAIYFFHKYILDDVDLTTLLQVFLPFAAFFFLSLFMPYLEKPVIKQVSREELERRGSRRGAQAAMQPVPTRGKSRAYQDQGEYNPKTEYMTGTIDALPPAVATRTSVVDLPTPYRAGQGRPAAQQAARRPRTDPEAAVARSRSGRTSAGLPGMGRKGEQPAFRRPSAEAPTAGKRESAPMRKETEQPQRRPVKEAAPPEPAVERRPQAQPVPERRTAPPVRRETDGAEFRRRTPAAPPAGEQPVLTPAAPAAPVTPVSTAPAAESPRTVTSVEIPSVNDDFFAKYDDPEYVEKRLREQNLLS